MQNKKNLLIFGLSAVLFFSAYSFALADDSTTSTPSLSSLATTTTSSDLTNAATASSSDLTITSSSTPMVLGLQAPIVPPLISEIKQAKLQLEAITLNHALAAVYKTTKNKKTGKTTKIISKYNLTNKDIA